MSGQQGSRPPLKTEEWSSWWMPWLLWGSVGIMVALIVGVALLGAFT